MLNPAKIKKHMPGGEHLNYACVKGIMKWLKQIVLEMKDLEGYTPNRQFRQWIQNTLW